MCKKICSVSAQREKQYYTKKKKKKKKKKQQCALQKRTHKINQKNELK